MNDLSQELQDLLKDLERPLLGYCMSLVRDLESSRDIAQHAFIQYAQARQAGHVQISNPKAWLYRVAYNKAMDEQRRRQRQARATAALTQEHPDHDARHPAAEQLLMEISQGVEQALNCLNELEQRIMRLRLHEELSYAEIASRTQIQSSHVGVILHRGLRKLASHMALQGDLQP